MANMRYNGESLLVGTTLSTYLRMKPLEYALEVIKVKDTNYEQAHKTVKCIESNIRVGDLFLYKVRKTIADSFKDGDYNNMLVLLNNMYNAQIDGYTVYTHIMQKLDKG